MFTNEELDLMAKALRNHRTSCHQAVADLREYLGMEDPATRKLQLECQEETKTAERLVEILQRMRRFDQ